MQLTKAAVSPGAPTAGELVELLLCVEERQPVAAAGRERAAQQDGQ
jgi:hypothetical protein